LFRHAISLPVDIFFFIFADFSSSIFVYFVCRRRYADD
jgi:hypothetical protein